MKIIGFAVIGTGRIGALHATLLMRSVSRSRLVAVMDAHVEHARHALGEDAVAYGVSITDSLDAVLQNPAVDAVVIGSPTSLHADHIVAAARAGKAVFCEKPVSLDLAAAEAAMRVVEECKVPFQIGFQRRYDPGFAGAHEKLTGGAIGDLEMLRSLSCDPQPSSMEYLRTSGGIFCDMAIHDIDLARFYGGDIESVTAMGTARILPALAEIGDVDTSILTLRFKSGAIGVIQNWRRAAYGYDIRTELLGSRGKLVVEEEQKTSVRQYDHDGIHMDYHGWFLKRFRNAYRFELQAFVDALCAGHRPTPGPRAAVEALRVALAATRSLREGRTLQVAEIQTAGDK